MTILQDECKPTQQTPSDAVVELMAQAICEADPGEDGKLVTYGDQARAILSALSDAGLEIVLRADHPKGKPMIEDLEKILEESEGSAVRIKPDGSVIAVTPLPTGEDR